MTASSMRGPRPQSTHETELAVVGGGIAGMVAATRAAELGRKVIVVEKGTQERYLCNTRMTGGALHICMRDIDGDPDQLFEAIAQCTDNKAQPDVARALIEDAPRARDWLKHRGVIMARVPLLNQQNVITPLRTNHPGSNNWLGRAGDALLRTLESQLRKAGGSVVRGATVTELLMDGDICRGLSADMSDGRTLRVNASAVLIADGGWQTDIDLLRKHVSHSPEGIKQRNAATGSGDGARLVSAVGGNLIGMDDGFYGHLLARDAISNEELWPFPIMDFLAAAGIVVDANGHRFCDEGQGGITVANRIAALENPLDAMVIFDEAIWQGPGRFRAVTPNPHLVLAGGTVNYQTSLASLAQEMGIPPNNLERTVADYNAALAAGRLLELAPPRTTATFKAWPIVRAPFYSIRLCAGITFTMGGIHIDANARVLRTDASPIEGLYAAGATTGGLDGGPRSGYVGGLMKSAVFGMRAAETMSGECADIGLTRGASDSPVRSVC